MEDQYSEDLLKVVSFSERVPMASKKANNYAWAKLRADGLDHLYPDTFDSEYINRVEDNYRLMNGMPMENYTAGAYRASAIDLAALRSEGIDVPDTKIEHFDFISPYIDGLWGDQKSRKLKFMVTDSSLFTQNYIKDYVTQNLQSHFDQKLIQPARQQALLQWQTQNGVQDLSTLTEDQKKQVQSDVQASVESLVPKDIMAFMRQGRVGQLEIQGQAIAEALVATLDLKYTLDEAYRHSFATDGIVFYSGIRRGKPYTEIVDLTHFNTGGTNNIFIDDNPWFKRVQVKHPSIIWTEYADQFTKGDIQKFQELVSFSGNTVETAKDEKFVERIDFEGKALLNNTNLLTIEGQNQYSHILQKYQGENINDFKSIRVAHLVWMSLEKMRRITRGVGDGEFVDEWFTEDYEFNPTLGDLKEEIRWVPRYWQATKIGQGESAIYVDVGPVPHQRRDITDPYKVHSPFTGGFLNDMMGKGFRRSNLDKIKTFIHAANFQMKTIRDREATDIGKVILMTVAAKPKGWTWGKLIEVVRTTKMLPIDTQASGLTPMDVQFFRSVDLGNLFDILPRINYLQFLIGRMGEGLSNNAARQGNPAASTSVSNNMSNLNRSFSQTHGRAAWLDKITERLIENQIYYGTKAAKNGNIFMRYVLDDLSIANIDIDVEEIDKAYFGVKVVADEMDMQTLDVAKNLLLPFIQNKGLTYQLAVETLLASTRGELLNVASKAEFENQIQQAKALDFQKMSAQELSARQLQNEKDLLEWKSMLKMKEDVPNNEAKKEMAAINSLTIAHGNDLNNNQVNDYSETADKDREFKREELYVKDAQVRDIELAKEALDREALLINEKTDLAKIAAINTPTPPKSTKKR